MYNELEQLRELVGRKHVFEDGDSIEILQIKSRSEDPLDTLVTVHIQQGPGIPRKLVFNSIDFKNNYGHLFGIEDTIDRPSEPFDSI